ncbi:hypothetical protein Agub_g619 [Astrephomene gubernaculifera]|uniref:Uncharacterized protein n=1 Tax=Astrephomene gubernaculifera TaxID=47775 RepID=A0AAD3DE24_9CHLO|nr:hypothetical protein Agub_g619 [Astrephomene gubernaculifera]
MEPTAAAGQLVVASDIRTSLFKRALTLLDDVHAGLEEFSFGPLQPNDGPVDIPDEPRHEQPQLALVPARATPHADPSHAGALAPQSGDDILGRVLASLVQGRTNTAKRAVDAVAQIHSEIDSLLTAFERDYPPMPAGASSRVWDLGASIDATLCQPSEEVLRMAAATTSAAARFRLRAAEAAQLALQTYDNAAKQAAIAAQATTRALEMQLVAEQHSASGNLAQALDAIRQANRLRDESVEAARNSQQLQQQYLRHRREAQEAHAQADAAMRHAYSLERDALRSSSESASRAHAKWKERHDRLFRQTEELQTQAVSWEGQAEAAAARAQLAQQQADAQMAAGNYDLGNALMEEAIRAQEQVGYARAQATAAREAYQRLMPDVRTARERMEVAERQLQELSQRQTLLQDATSKQRKDRLQEEADELEALCSAAESAAALHEELVQVYEERLAQDQEQYNALLGDGKAAEADALAVHINTWQELLEVARQNRDVSRTEATNMKARLQELSNLAVRDVPAADLEENPAEEFVQLKVAQDREARATQAAALLARELAANPLHEPPADPAQSVESTGSSSDGLLLQTELHHQRSARLAQQLHSERRRLAEAELSSPGEDRPADAQAEALLDSMAVSHLVGTLETTRLLQLWKQRSDQAASSAEEMRKTWAALEQDASTKADEAVRLEEQALALEHAGNAEEAASTMARADALHRMSEQLRVEADKAKAVLHVREKAAMDAQTQSRFLVQGLHDVEHAAERLQEELRQRGYDMGAQQELGMSASQPSLTAVPRHLQQSQGGMRTLADEMSTVMMASPSMLSRDTSSVSLNASFGHSVAGTARARDATSAGCGGQLSEDSALGTGRESVFWDQATSGQQMSAREQGASSPGTQGLGPNSGASAADMLSQGERLANLMQHLESRAPTVAASSTSPERAPGSDLLAPDRSRAAGGAAGQDSQLARLLQQLQLQASTTHGVDLVASGLTAENAAALAQAAGSGDGSSLPGQAASLARLMQQLESHAPIGEPISFEVPQESGAAPPQPAGRATGGISGQDARLLELAEKLASQASAVQALEHAGSGATVEFGAPLPDIRSGTADSVVAHDTGLARLMQQLESQGPAGAPASFLPGVDSGATLPQLGSAATVGLFEPELHSARLIRRSESQAAAADLENSGQIGSRQVLSAQRAGGLEGVLEQDTNEQQPGEHAAAAPASREPGVDAGSEQYLQDNDSGRGIGATGQDQRLAALQQLLDSNATGSAPEGSGLAMGDGLHAPLLSGGMVGPVGPGASQPPGRDGATGQDARFMALQQLLGSHAAGDPASDVGLDATVPNQHTGGRGAIPGQVMGVAALKQLLGSQPAAIASSDAGAAAGPWASLPSQQSGGSGRDPGQDVRMARLQQLLGSSAAADAGLGDQGSLGDTELRWLQQLSGGGSAPSPEQEASLAGLQQLLGLSGAEATLGSAQAAVGSGSSSHQQRQRDGSVAGQDPRLVMLKQLLESQATADALVGSEVTVGSGASRPYQQSSGGIDTDTRLAALAQLLQSPAAQAAGGVSGLSVGQGLSTLQRHDGGISGASSQGAHAASLGQRVEPHAAAGGSVGSGLAANLDTFLPHHQSEGAGGGQGNEMSGAVLATNLVTSLPPKQSGDADGNHEQATRLAVVERLLGAHATAASSGDMVIMSVGSNASSALQQSGGADVVPGQDARLAAAMQQHGSREAAGVYGNPGLTVEQASAAPYQQSGGSGGASAQDMPLLAPQQLLGPQAAAAASDMPAARHMEQFGLRAPSEGLRATGPASDGQGTGAGSLAPGQASHKTGNDTSVGVAQQDERLAKLLQELGPQAPGVLSADAGMGSDGVAKLAELLRAQASSGDNGSASGTVGPGASLLLQRSGASNVNPGQDANLARLAQLLGPNPSLGDPLASGLGESLLQQWSEAAGSNPELAMMTRALEHHASVGAARSAAGLSAASEASSSIPQQSSAGHDEVGHDSRIARLAEVLKSQQASEAGPSRAGSLLPGQLSGTTSSSHGRDTRLLQLVQALESQDPERGRVGSGYAVGPHAETAFLGSGGSGGGAGQDLRLTHLMQQLETQQGADGLDGSGRAAGSRPAGSAGSIGGSAVQEGRLGSLVRELESQAGMPRPEVPSNRWDGHAALAFALQASTIDDSVLAAASSSLAVSQAKTRECLGLVQAQRQTDDERQTRLQELLAALPPDKAPTEVVERAAQRCEAVAAASNLAESALTIQANSHDALVLSLSAYRRALAGQKAATEAARSAGAEAAALGSQAEEARHLDDELLQHVQRLEAELSVFEAQGSTAQALTTQFELQRTRNKHAEVGARASQLSAAHTAAQQRAEQAELKEIEATANVETLNKMVEILAEAANEADAGVQHALEGYTFAVSALNLGAQTDLANLDPGAAAAGAAVISDADVQQHLERHADSTARAQQCVAATRRLQEVADAECVAGKNRVVAAVEQAARSRAATQGGQGAQPVQGAARQAPGHGSSGTQLTTAGQGSMRLPDSVSQAGFGSQAGPFHAAPADSSLVTTTVATDARSHAAMSGQLSVGSSFLTSQLASGPLQSNELVAALPSGGQLRHGSSLSSTASVAAQDLQVAAGDSTSGYLARETPGVPGSLAAGGSAGLQDMSGGQQASTGSGPAAGRQVTTLAPGAASGPASNAHEPITGRPTRSGPPGPSVCNSADYPSHPDSQLFSPSDAEAALQLWFSDPEDQPRRARSDDLARRSALLAAALAKLPDDTIQGVLAVEAEMASLNGMHEQQLLGQLGHSARAAENDRPQADDAERLARQRELLAAQLQHAEEQLEAVRVQQSSLDNASPAEVQASHDRMQYHEHRIAMLQQALQACEQLDASKSALQQTRAEVEAVELEARRCEKEASVLTKAAEAYGAAASDLERASNEAPGQAGTGAALQERLDFVRGISTRIAQRQQQIKQRADASQRRHRQLVEKIASEESAVELREQWLEQAEKAADTAAAAIAWEDRLTTARLELQELEAPIAEQQDKAKAAAGLAHTMASAAAQHRKQAGDLARQAAEQRDKSRRMAASGRRQEAEACSSIADSLQQQADGLLAQAVQMEGDAQKLRAEAQELGQAAEQGKARAAVHADVLEQVSAAHNLSVSMLQWQRTAANKLQEASQKQTATAQQQQALAEAEKELAAMEAQKAGSNGSSKLRPDELATHMINVARAKQQASLMRTTLRAAQQQLEQDRDAAVAAARQAAKAEAQRAQLEPRIAELEQQAHEADADAAASSAPEDESAGDTAAPEVGDAQDDVIRGSPRETPFVSPHGELPGRISGGPLQTGSAGRGSPVLTHSAPAGPLSAANTGARDLKASAPPQLTLPRTSVEYLQHSESPDGSDKAEAEDMPGVQLQRNRGVPAARYASIDLKPQRNLPDDAGLGSPIGSSGGGSSSLAPGSGSHRGPHGALAARQAPHAGLSSRNLAKAAVGSSPLARIRLGAKGNSSLMRTPQVGHGTAGVPALGGPSAGASPLASPTRHTSRAASRMLGARDGAQLPEDEEACSPSSLAAGLPRALLQIPSLSGPHQDSPLSQSLVIPGSPDGIGAQAVGTAGALLEKVAGKSLRPLSHITQSVALLASKQGRDSVRTTEDGHQRAATTTGSVANDDPGQRAGTSAKEDRRVSKADVGDDNKDEEEQHDQDAEAEPDTKMYRTVKQRLDELGGRVTSLRRQSDAANAAAELMCRKQDQLRMDRSATRDADEEQRAALLDHGDAMIRLKEAEAAWCQKQADLLEDEATACQDAVQYAVVDWHLRREAQRLEARCTVLSGKAQAKAVDAQGHETDAADALECITLATARGARLGRAYAASLEQQNLTQFMEEQRARVQVARRRAAESRAEAAQIAAMAKKTVAGQLLCEKKTQCNKALYQSAVELAEAYGQSAKMAALVQRYRLLSLKAAADAAADRVQQLGGATPDSMQSPDALPPAKPRGTASQLPRSPQPQPEVLDGIARLTGDTADAIQQYLDEVADGSSEAMHVLRKRMGQLSMLLQLYQSSHDAEDYVAGASDGGAVSSSGTSQQQQPLSEAAKRAGRIAAAEKALLDLDRACAFASELRTMCVEAAGAHAALCDARSEPNAIQMQLMGQKAANLPLDQEEIDKQQHRVADLEVQVPLARDQLSAALQVAEYRQAAAQLAEAQQNLQYAATVASDAGKGLDSTLAVRREVLSMMRNHMASVLDEARVFTASGNLLQAAAAEEAADRLAKDALAAETALAATMHEAQLKADEHATAQAAAEELQQVAESSSELVSHLLRIIDLQQEARTVTRRANELDVEHQRLEQEAKSRRSLAESASKDAELLQHESLQCRTNLNFAAADAHLSEARQCRASALQHSAAAASAEQAASAALAQHKTLVRHGDYLLREVQLRHVAAQHLQDALSCMRDKHHLVRRLRDAEYQQRCSQMSPAADEQSGDMVPELEVLQTQVTASNTTIQHHLASKASYVSAADHLHLATTSLHRAAECSSQAGAAMQELVKARMSAAAAGTATSASLLTDGRSTGATSAGLPASSRLALVPFNAAQEEAAGPRPHTATTSSMATTAPSFPASWQLHQAELRHRCLRGSILVLQAIAEAAKRACEARRRQVELSDQAASLVSDLAAKILEAEANADEAAGVEAAVRRSGVALDEDDEESLKAKLMINALLQQAEAYRGEATALQGRIKELEQEDRAADAEAADLEASLRRLQADHRHSLEALDLTERIAQCREQEAALRVQARALMSEVATLEHEAGSLESKAGQLRQQLTSASHSASSEDVANLMLVMQQMAAKAAAHRAAQQQRRAELEGLEAERGRLAGDVVQMAQRAEHVLQAGETQEQVRQASAHIQQLKSELSSAQSAHGECARMLEELRQQYEELAAAPQEPDPTTRAAAMGSGSSTLAPSTAVPTRQKQQIATTQAAITLSEQMLETHNQRLQVLQAAVAGWEAAKQRLHAVVRYQEQVMQQAEWHATLSRQHSELQAAAAEHVEKARQLRSEVGKGATAAGGGADREGRRSLEAPGVEATSAVRSQAAAIRTASEAARQHALADAEDALAVRAAALATEVSNQADRLLSESERVRPMLERLRLAASAAVSVARLQLVCVGICANQGNELTTMHEKLGTVRDLASRIQGLLEAADRHMRAGQGMEAAAARGQATAVQEVLQKDLKVVRSCRHRLTQLQSRMQDAKQEFSMAEGRMSQVMRPAAVGQSIAEYVHQACELHFECADRQRDILRLLRLAAEAMGRADVAQREYRASKEAAEQLAKSGKTQDAAVVQRAAAALDRYLADAESQRRILEAQAVQAADVCTSAMAAASLYHDLAGLSLRLLQHMDELDLHREEHSQLQGELETVGRSLEAARALLQQRRGEMEALSSQLEAHRKDAHALRRVGNDAQAHVREEAADLLTTQLAEIADGVVNIEQRCAALEKQQSLMSSLHAKSEARVGLLSQLARLCSAGVGHLLDARDAHLNHSTCMRNAALSSVEVIDNETALAKTEARVRELQESSMRLQREQHELFGFPGSDLDIDMAGGEHTEDPEAALRAANLARAELLMSQRQRAQLEQQLLASRGRAAQAELAAQSSQLRITKARQRAEDAQRLAECIVSMLEGSRAQVIDFGSLRTLGWNDGGSAAAGNNMQLSTGAMLPSPAATGSITTNNLSPGILAAAQLHSVTLQTMTEAALKFTQALDCAATAENSRSSALASEKAAQAAFEAAQRQQAVVGDLREAAEGANVAQEVQRMQNISHGDKDAAAGRPGAAGSGGLRGPGSSWLTSFGAAAAREAQDALAAAELELERLQHEAAYLEATAAQEHKLVSCLEQQHALLRRSSDCLLDMARFGIAAELKASPGMRASEAAAVFAACQRLSQQHAAAMLLTAPLDCCKEAEACLRASLERVREARSSREQALSRRLSALGAAAGRGEGTTTAAAASSCKSSTDDGSQRGSLHPFATAEEAAAAEVAALLSEHDQLLAEEERLLQQVQQLDDSASELLGEGAAQVHAFSAQWEEASRPAAESPERLERPALVSTAAAPPRMEVAAAVEPAKGSSTPTVSSLRGAVSVLPVRPGGGSRDGSSGSRSAINAPQAATLSLQPSVHQPVALSHDGSRDVVASISSQLERLPSLPSVVDRSSQQSPSGHRREASRGPGQSPARSEPRARPSGGATDEIDPDLVAMAAAAVARAKEAAAALATRGQAGSADGQRAYEAPSMAVNALPTMGGNARHESGLSAFMHPSSLDGSFSLPSSIPSVATSSHPGNYGPGSSVVAHGMESATDMGAPHGLLKRSSNGSFGTDADGSGRSRPAGPRQVPQQPHAGERGQQWPLRELPSCTTDTSNTLLSLPSSSLTDAMPSGPPRSSYPDWSLAARHGRPMHDASRPPSDTASSLLGSAAGLSRLQESAAAAAARQVPPTATAAPATAALPREAPALPRLSLPDDLDPVTASGLMHLWSTAALHYGRAQHIHDGSAQLLEQQWERCQLQLQLLQAEEVKARTGGRAAEADAAAATAAKWRQRASRLQTALQRQVAEASRYKALLRRATAMGERLQLLAAATATGSGRARLGGGSVTARVAAEMSGLMRHLVPRLPGSALAGCGALQALERLHGELVQHVAALNAVAAGLQAQSQRLFAKASGRSGKLRAHHGASEDAASYATAMAKSQSLAEQAASYGERAVELAGQAQSVQQLAERLSAETGQCAQASERLQRAAEQELAAQQALVQAVELLLCEAMRAVMLGDEGAASALDQDSVGRGDGAGSGLTGDLDSLLRAGHPPGVCLAAARGHARRGEDLSQEAARVVQGAKEQLEARLGTFARCMEEAAAALSAQASQRSRQQESLAVQGDAAALCVARARSKAATRQAAGDAASAEKYGRAVEGWVKQTEKLRREASVAASDVEELSMRSQALAGLASRLRPLQASLDRYLDEQLEAWASAALSRVHQRGV